MGVLHRRSYACFVHLNRLFVALKSLFIKLEPINLCCNFVNTIASGKDFVSSTFTVGTFTVASNSPVVADTVADIVAVAAVVGIMDNIRAYTIGVVASTAYCKQVA